MRKWLRRSLLTLVAIGLVIGVVHAHSLMFIGSGYAAQQTCACLFISGRTVDSCRGDLDPLAKKLVRLAPGDNEVRASALFSSATARYQPGFGCMLQN